MIHLLQYNYSTVAQYLSNKTCLWQQSVLNLFVYHQFRLNTSNCF